jgi:hypothetical protein
MGAYGNPADNEIGQTNDWAYGAQTLVWGLAGADLEGTPGFAVTGNHYLTWKYDSGDPSYNGLYGHYSPGKPIFQRFGPFIDISKTTIRRPNELPEFTRQTNIPAIAGNYNWYPDSRVIADNFGMPVLYYVADTGGTAPTTYYPGDNGSPRDNRPFTHGHPLHDYNYFMNFVGDERTPASGGFFMPNNRDSYLLISAGLDGSYGTGDDITNFPLGQQ